MFVTAQVGLEETPLVVAREGLAAYAADPAALRHDSEVALHTVLDSVGGKAGSVLPIEVLSAPVRHHAGATMMPVRWLRRAAPPGEMPLLDANVEVVGTGHGTVELVAVASYRPPPPAADPAAGQRLAERMLRTLLLGVAATIPAAASDGSAATS